jgi:F-type H+-transporting ATPase subunit epsilon
MQAFPLKIISAKASIIEGQVTLLNIVTIAGQVGILANHTPLLSIVKTGEMHLIEKGKTIYYAVSGGVLSVRRNEVILLVEAIEKADDIDLNRAKDALKRAKERLEAKSEKVDELRAKTALSRALNRIDVFEKYSK